jgi:anti-anti-sigma factor
MTVELDTGTPPPNRVELTSAARDVAVVALIGEHDLGHFTALKSVLARAAVRARNVVVDLSDCAFMDSTTLRVVLHTHAVTTKAGGALAVVVAPEPGQVKSLAEIVRLDQILPVHASLDAAMASFAST